VVPTEYGCQYPTRLQLTEVLRPILQTAATLGEAGVVRGLFTAGAA
jgi:hypothetical protein